MSNSKRPADWPPVYRPAPAIPTQPSGFIQRTANPALRPPWPLPYRPTPSPSIARPPAVQPLAVQRTPLPLPQTTPPPSIQLTKARERTAARAAARHKATKAKPGRDNGPTRTRFDPKLASKAAEKVAKKKESTAVTLRVGRSSFDGRTGLEGGHAEMHALSKIIAHYGDAAAAKIALDASSSKVVACTEKPVCARCAIVLKEMGFTRSPGTVWGGKGMGSTQWWTNTRTNELLKLYGLNREEISNQKF